MTKLKDDKQHPAHGKFKGLHGEALVVVSVRTTQISGDDRTISGVGPWM